MSERATFTGLEPYQLNNDQMVEKSRELGHGSYASVVELEYMGLRCAGKKIHDMLLRQGDDTYTVRRFEEECRLLSQVRHPNIVQFLGVYFRRGISVPMLVMESLPTNLTSCIEQFGILPKEISYSILHDVALGLCYLHSQTPPIIHRDLSSNNVLLSANMTAKISDLGVARILNLTPLQVSRMTETPGTPAYMPPEVMVANPKYDTTIDVFSFGTMMIHVFSGMWPEPQVGPVRTEPGKLIPVSEAERRDVFLQVIGKDHPLMDLILKCIENHPQARAHTSEIVQRLAAVRSHPSLSPNRLEMLRNVKSLEEERSRLREEVMKKDVTVREKNDAIARLQASEQEFLKRVEFKEEEIRALRDEMEERSSKAEEMVTRLKADNEELLVNVEALHKEIKEKDRRNLQLASKVIASDTEKRKLKKEADSLQGEVSRMNTALEQKNKELLKHEHEVDLSSMKLALEQKDKELEKQRIDKMARVEEISQMKIALKKKDDEITRLIQDHRAEILRLKMDQIDSPCLEGDGDVRSDRPQVEGASVSGEQSAAAGAEINPTMQRGKPRVVMQVDSGTLQQVVLPDGVKHENWIAINLMNFCKRVSVLYETVLHVCTETSCPVMSGGPKFLYYWADEKQKKPQALPAPKYIAKLMKWAEKQMKDERVFPRNFKAAVLEPDSVIPICKKIFRRLYRVFVHIYVFHFDQFVEIRAEMNLNSCYIHFYYFVREYDLVPLKELEPLMELNFQLIEKKKLLQ